MCKAWSRWRWFQIRVVEQLAMAAVYPPLHERVHPGHPDAAAHDHDARVGENHVEQRRVPAVPVPDEEAGLAAVSAYLHTGRSAYNLGW